MSRRYKTHKKQNKVINVFITHVENNIKEYSIISIMFVIGIIVGIAFINNLSKEQSDYITNYMQNFISNFKIENNVETLLLLKDSITKNFILVLLLWFMGSTVIGLLIVYLIILFRGFCLGYTLSTIILTFGTAKGCLFAVISMLLQNMIFIPCIISLAVSGVKLYKSIMQDRRRENIKMQIIRHTIFSIFALIVMILSSLIEVYISTNLLSFFINYI